MRESEAILAPLAAEVDESTGAKELELDGTGSEEGVDEGERSFLSARRLDPGMMIEGAGVYGVINASLAG